MAPKVRTDKALVEKFLTRGVEQIYPSVEALRKKLLSGERIRAYQGFDPTGPYLHVGHAIGIRALRILQELGHEVVFVVGDFTSMIGDPDKSKARKILTENEVKTNMKGWKKQAAQLINFDDPKNPVRFERNSKWLSKLKFEDVLKLTSHATVQQMLERDLFARRIKEQNPIGLHELLYPLMQGYDNIAIDVDLELGGADQTFNMLVGRSLMKAYRGREKFVRANKMMDAPDGITMSKTRGNGINLGDTAAEMYGKAMSYPDAAIASGLELLTDMPMVEIEAAGKEISSGANPMEFKKRLALEIVKTIKGKREAEKAQAEFEKVFQKREAPGEATAVKIVALSPEALVAIGAAPSKSEARRLIKQGAVRINNEKLSDCKTTCPVKKGDIIQIGPHRFFRST